jgi:carbon monoxide dehydrogenase subunit G
MDNMSYFESRSGKLTCNPEEAFTFVTDIRNFERFIPNGTINNWHAERDSCSFDVSMVGTVSFRLAEKDKFTRVVFNGDALKKNDFSLVLHISENGNNPADVKVSLSADLNPMMKMVAAKPIGQFLEILINEMESFSGWKATGD